MMVAIEQLSFVLNSVSGHEIAEQQWKRLNAALDGGTQAPNSSLVILIIDNIQFSLLAVAGYIIVQIYKRLLLSNSHQL